MRLSLPRSELMTHSSATPNNEAGSPKATATSNSVALTHLELTRPCRMALTEQPGVLRLRSYARQLSPIRQAGVRPARKS